MLGGRKVTVTRPRARHLDGSGEVELASSAWSRGSRPATTPPASNRSATSRRFESMISIGRTTMRNVKRWRDGKMIERWTAAGMLEAERRFYCGFTTRTRLR